MYPRVFKSGSYQRGFLMPLAAFILVAMGLMALTLSRNTAQTSIASTQEAISVQTFYAAESGAQWGANRLFYNTVAPLTRLGVDAVCTGLAGNLSFSAAGLGGCSAQVSCACVYSDGTACSATAGPDYDGSSHFQSFYTVTSAATCGTGEVDAARTIIISAFLEDE